MVELGHVALRVRELERAIDFYRRAVGLTLVGRFGGGRAAVLTGGSQHHELLLVAAPSLEAGKSSSQPLYHVAWKVGLGLDALRAAKGRLDRMGIPIDGAVDHAVSWSLYLRDPEGNQVELFADNPDVDWRRSSEWLQAPSRPVDLSSN
jgi:catechol 2,3-dioxygenase